MPTRDELYADDRVWAMAYRDGKSLGEIAKSLKCSIYDLSPWLMNPMYRTIMEVLEDKSHPERWKPWPWSQD
jgi:hypothetical protein